jgi:hypothetical protein
MEIPLNVNEVGVPLSVLQSLLCDTIKVQCQELRIEVPEEMQGYIDTYHQDEAGFNWMDRLLKASCEMSPELLQRWVEALPGCHFYRAEMRALLKQKYANHEGG